MFDRQTPRRAQQQQPARDSIARLQQQQSGSNEFRGPPQAQSGDRQPQRQMGGDLPGTPSRDR
jgi:hypothetical protein